MDATIVGGGIGGLATAIGLGRAGWRVTLLERQPALTATGAGLLIWPNGARALEALGVGPQVAARAVPHTGGAGGLRRPDGRPLATIDPTALAARLGSPPLTMHRADLHEILVAALPASVEVRTGVDVTGVPADGDLVVAADGVHSALRAGLSPSTRIRDSGQIAWRAITPDTFDLRGGGETVGRNGWRFGMAPVGARGVYWYAAGPGPLRTGPPADWLAEMRELFAGWHEPIAGLLVATSPDDLLQHRLTDLDPVPPMRFDDRIALLGDAAHAMTPNLGQGAAQALEDAVTLAFEVGDGRAAADVAGGLARYEAARRPRVERILRQSRLIGDVLGTTGRARSALRDLVLRATPARVMLNNVARTASWNPPAGLPAVTDRP